jgi:hypothetical protein
VPIRRTPTDDEVAALLRILTQGEAELDRLIADALSKGADATAAYRTRQLASIRRTVETMRAAAPAHVVGAAVASYRIGVHGVDIHVDGQALAFGGAVHERALQQIATAMVGTVDGAIATVGRRARDAFQQATVGEVGKQIAIGGTRREASKAIERSLRHDGITAFIDKRGARWTLSNYTEMAARTTAREAMSLGTANRLTERGMKLVTVSSHNTTTPICQEFEGKTYALPGTRVTGYQVLPRLAPFHPNCWHVIRPAGANLDIYEAALTGGPVPIDPTRAPARRGGRKLKGQTAPEREAAPPPPPPKPQTPTERIAARIADERRRVGEENLDITTAGEVFRVAVGRSIAQKKAIVAAHRAGPEAVAKLSQTDQDLLHSVLSDSLAVRDARIALEAGTAPLPEATVTDIGREILDHINKVTNERLGKVTAELVDVQAKHEAAFGEWNSVRLAGGTDRDLFQRQYDLKKRLWELRQARADVADVVRREALAEIRPGFGTGKIDFGGTRKTWGQAVDHIAERLPREWVEQGNAHFRVTFKSSRARAHYSASEQYLRVRPADLSTALHEYGHHMEASIARLRALQDQFLVRRTTRSNGVREEPISLRRATGINAYDASEMTREDKFTNAYIGKEYGGRHYEVLTMGLEGVFHGRHGIGADEDLQRFILGLLAAV